MRYVYDRSWAKGRSAHAFRNTFLERRMPPLHTHDFFELYWVESGSVREARARGTAELKAGDLRFASPGTAHAFSAPPDARLSMANVIFPGRLAPRLARRHGLTWKGGYALSARALAALSKEFDLLAHSEGGLLDAESFLLQCFKLLRSHDAPQPDGPPWLQRALQALEAPGALAKGAGAFFEAAGRSPEHAARECKRHTGKSPIQLATELRLRHAARLLEASTMEITEIALDCGLENLGHFYAQFKRAYKLTPRQWRLRARRPAGLA